MVQVRTVKRNVVQKYFEISGKAQIPKKMKGKKGRKREI